MNPLPPPSALSRRDQNLGAIISWLAITLLLVYIAVPVLGFGSEAALLAAFALSLLASAGLCLYCLIRYRREGNPFMIDYLNIGVQRYVLAILMALYGIDKLLGNFFDYQLFALDSRLGDVSEFQLSWFFYGKNRWQELFAGIMEFVPGLLLLRRSTYYIAALVLLPVTAQVFLLNFFFKIGGVTFPVSTILLACNGYLIYSQKEKIILFFRSLNFGPVAAITGRAKTVLAVLRSAGILLVLLLLVLKLRPVMFKSPAERKYQQLVGVYALKAMKKNSAAYIPVDDSLLYKDLYIEKQPRWDILRRFNSKTDAFILKMNARNDSVALYINRTGMGDGPKLLDSATAFKGTYRLSGKTLLLKGIQRGDTLELAYERQDRLKPKKWFW